MAKVSQFSTPERLQQLDSILNQIEQGMNEVRLAQQAGIPGADQHMADLEKYKMQVEQIKNTYFPTGSAPAS